MDEWAFGPARLIDMPLSILIRNSAVDATGMFLWDLLCTTILGQWRTAVLLMHWNLDFWRAWHDPIYATASLSFFIVYPRLLSLGGFNLLIALNVVNGNLLKWLWYWWDEGNEDGWEYTLGDAALAACHTVAAFLLPNSDAIWRLIRRSVRKVRNEHFQEV